MHSTIGSIQSSRAVLCGKQIGFQFSETTACVSRSSATTDETSNPKAAAVPHETHPDPSPAPPSTSADGLFFYSTLVTQLLGDKPLSEKKDLLADFREELASTAFTYFTARFGLVDGSFELNKAACAGNIVHDRFISAVKKLPQLSTLAIVFHGTGESNIPNILQHGLDPKKRTGQAYGPGEYFSADPGISSSFCHGGKKMLVFVVVVPNAEGPAKERTTYTCPPPEYVVVPTSEHQLPLGVINFLSISKEALNRSATSKQTLHLLSKQLLQRTREAEDAKLKATIIQILITKGLDVASEFYNKNKDGLCELSKKEISMYAYRLYDADFIAFYFEDLPKPMTAQERDVAAIKSVDCLEKEVTYTKQMLAKERLNLAKMIAPPTQPARPSDSLL